MFSLYEKCQQLFNVDNDAFSYYEAASEVHIEIDSRADKLPSTDGLVSLIDSISLRDSIVIDIETYNYFSYSVEKTDWKNEYVDFLNNNEADETAKIKIHVQKAWSDDNVLSIYCFDEFWGYYGENLNKTIKFFADLLKRRSYLRFFVFDKEIKLFTSSVFFSSCNDWPTDVVDRIECIKKCEQIGLFFNRNDISLTPKDFEILQSTENILIAKTIFGKLETLLSLLHLADTSYISEDMVFIQFSSEFSRINYRLSEQFVNNDICDIFKWAFVGENSINKFVIARNVIGIKCNNIDGVKRVDINIFNSIKSSYTISQRKITEEYISMKKDISEFIVESSQQMQEIICSLTDGLKNNFVAIIMFFITIILTDSLDWNDLLSGEKISTDLCWIIYIFLASSLAYLIVSVVTAVFKWKFYKADFNRLKQNYSTMLDEQDIEDAFKNDEPLTTVRKRTIVSSIIICTSWIAILALIVAWLINNFRKG
ncbi:MAG: hypothetical protein HDT43_03340 [Ruminococcaceae bacterium]|nr:hypothetical protein [Oscillospiraceae bacterium]